MRNPSGFALPAVVWLALAAAAAAVAGANRPATASLTSLEWLSSVL